MSLEVYFENKTTVKFCNFEHESGNFLIETLVQSIKNCKSDQFANFKPMPTVQAIRVSCHLFYNIKETLQVEMNRDKEREVSPMLPI